MPRPLAVDVGSEARLAVSAPVWLHGALINPSVLPFHPPSLVSKITPTSTHLNSQTPAMSNPTSSGPQQEVAGTLPNNFSLRNNMEADPKVPVNVVPNPEAGRDDVNTGGRGGDVLRQETQAHVSAPFPTSDPSIRVDTVETRDADEMRLERNRTSICPQTSRTTTPGPTSRTARCTLPTRVLISPTSKTHTKSISFYDSCAKCVSVL